MKNKISVSHKQLKQFLSPNEDLLNPMKAKRPQGIRPTRSLMESKILRPKPLKNLEALKNNSIS